ncbi:zinc finger protein 717-like isoform X2 [Calliphora vicina]|uniref:zinc finger protein 717-like isoform X2 n=1 Tax=Calliphora vicina TaxID=7373 RepID=UPI00325AE291
MSVDVIEPTCMLPQKRARESITLSDDSVSKCGELFVTNCADKWTFYCTYCQKATTDIGVFICHIRLEHLNEQQDLQQSQQTTPALASHVAAIQNDLNLDRSSSGTPIECSLPSEEPAANTEEQKQPIARHIVKEEPKVEARGQEHFDYMPICTTVSKIVDISALTQPASKEMEDDISDKNTTATSNASDELDEEFVALTAKDHETEQQQQQQQENMKIIEVFYRNDEAIEELESKIQNKGNDDQEEDDNDSATDYINTTESEDETTDYQTQLQREHQHNAEEEDEKASCSNRKKPKQKRKVKEDRDLLPHKCKICNLGFKSRQGVHFHISKIHDTNLHKKLPHKCAVCNRGFKTLQGLKYHNATHENKVKFKCPVCPATQYKLNVFINHVLTHESACCFPCQVCGKVYDSNSERMLHWQSHAKERPFGCNICYRRFRKQQYLTHHLKAHNQYQCHFCPFVFNSARTQRPPYVCNKCEQLPDLKQRVKHLRSLAEKSHVFESDED